MTSASKLPLGVGVYSFADAARFVGAESRELRRWLLGYSRTGARGESRSSPPLWTPQLDAFGIEGVGFRDLLELRFVRAFRARGVSLLAIREAANHARELLEIDHPFTCKEFRTDGRSIFVDIHNRTGDESLLDLVRRQHVFKSIVEPSLYSGIEFDKSRRALRWFPVARNRTIVLDPLRSFGQPIVTDVGVPTIALAEAFVAEGENASRVARLYEVTPDAVRKAVAYERQLARIH